MSPERMIVSKCAICGGKVEEREVSEEVRIGNDFVIIENVRAGVCVECGERYHQLLQPFILRTKKISAF